MADAFSVSQSLGRYADWANVALSDRQVAGMKAGSADSPKNIEICTTGIARLFHHKSVSQSRQAALDGFKAALTETVGTTLADLVWKSVGGKVAKGLTAGLVKDAIRLTSQYLERTGTKLAPPAGADGCLAQMKPEQVKKAVLGTMTDDVNTCRTNFNAVVRLSSANRLLGMMPASKAECDRLVEKFETMVGEFKKFGTASLGNQSAAKGTEKAVAERFDAMVGQLIEKRNQLTAVGTKLTNGKGPETKLAGHWTETVRAACQRLVNGAPKGMRGSMREAVDEFKKGCVEAKDQMLSRVKHEKKELGDHLQKELEKCVSAKFTGQDLKTAKSALSGLVAKCHLDLLNKRDWKPIEKTFTASVGGESFSLQSEIRSGVHIKEGMEFGYDEGVKAYNCHDLATNHAVNLGTTKLKVGGPNGGRTLFSGVRHGVHSAKGVENPAQANVNRAQETVMAAFANYLDAHPDANPSRPIDLRMTSVSLLTPSDEGKMLKAQNAAWNQINDKTMSVTVDGKTYQVTPHVRMFNYGVNWGAIGPISDILGGWMTSDRLNKGSLEKLLEDARAFPGGGRTDQKIVSAVKVLAGQIEAIAKGRGERKAGGDIYKMPSRIAVLSYLMGDVPVWNCKSGKDRSGWMDVECKFLATLIDRGMSIPAPNAKLTEDQQQLLHTILLESGNLELQEYNTGAGGYKLKNKGKFNVSSLYQRVGAAKGEAEMIMGGSKYIGS